MLHGKGPEGPQSLPLQPWDYKMVSPGAFYVGGGDQTWVLRPERQALYLLSCGPRLFIGIAQNQEITFDKGYSYNINSSNLLFNLLKYITMIIKKLQRSNINTSRTQEMSMYLRKLLLENTCLSEHNGQDGHQVRGDRDASARS